MYLCGVIGRPELSGGEGTKKPGVQPPTFFQRRGDPALGGNGSRRVELIGYLEGISKKGGNKENQPHREGHDRDREETLTPLWKLRALPEKRNRQRPQDKEKKEQNKPDLMVPFRCGCFRLALH